MPSPLYTFLDRFGEPLAQRVAQTFQILHDPLRDAGTTPAYDAALAALPRTCYPAQAEAAKALAKAFFVAGDRAVRRSEEFLCRDRVEGMTAVTAGQSRAVDGVERRRRGAGMASEYGAQADVDDHL